MGYGVVKLIDKTEYIYGANAIDIIVEQDYVRVVASNGNKISIPVSNVLSLIEYPATLYFKEIISTSDWWSCINVTQAVDHFKTEFNKEILYSSIKSFVKD